MPDRRDRSRVAAAVTRPEPEPVDVEEVGWMFHPEGQEWVRFGFRTWSEARPWIDHGFGPVAAHDWCMYSTVGDAETAARWRERFGDHPGIADLWQRNGFTDPNEAAAWEAEGYNPRGAAVMKDHGHRPETVRWGWENHGWDTHFGASWANAGFDPETADRYRRHGFGLEEHNIAGEWRDADGDIPVEIAAEWHTAGLTVYGYERWGTVGVNDPNEAAEWEHLLGDESAPPHLLYERWSPVGCGPQQTKFWLDEGFEHPEQVPVDERPGLRR